MESDFIKLLVRTILGSEFCKASVLACKEFPYPTLRGHPPLLCMFFVEFFLNLATGMPDLGLVKYQ